MADKVLRVTALKYLVVREYNDGEVHVVVAAADNRNIVFIKLHVVIDADSS